MRVLAMVLLALAGLLGAALLWANTSLEPVERCRAVAHDAVQCEIQTPWLPQLAIYLVALVPMLAAYALFEFSRRR